MPVAKSYKDLPRLCEPFEAKGRMYTKVKTKNGSEKIVRWYTTEQYNKMYPEEASEEYKRIRSVKDVLGFEAGPITIFKGGSYEDSEYFQLSKARYNRYWGWHFISTDEVPKDLPLDIEPITLHWEQVSKDGVNLMPESELKKVIEDIIYEPTQSQYAGEVGDRIEKQLTVTKAIPFETAYGTSTMHIFEDADKNEYVWSTGAKKLPVSATYQLRGTIKKLQKYHNSCQTVLTNCRVNPL